MDKESYSIDDILSEVKKHRAEQENENVNETPIKEVKPEPEEKEEVKVFEDKRPKEEEQNTVEDTTIVMKPIVEEVQNEEESEKTFSQKNEEETSEPEIPTIEEEESSYTDSEISDNRQTEEEKQEGMVDLLSLAQEDAEVPQVIRDEAVEVTEKKKKTKFSKTKKGKAIISIIIILLVMIIAAGVFALLYANNMLNKVTDNKDGEDYSMSTYYDGMDFLKEDFPSIKEASAGEVYSYAEYLKQWYQNGDPVSSTHVLNILLIGEDTREEKISDTSRADSAIIASINIDTKEIHLTSVLRDLYVYFEVDGKGQYGKINAAASMGGMKCYINAIERYYKIAINNYAVVNFNSFPKIIDELGGVTIKITSAEINEINNHPKTYGGVTIKQTFDGTEGKMLLNGKQALAYCRIRHIDSDGARANRQKTVLNALLKKMSNGGTVDTVKTVNALADYVYTGYSKKELISIGNTALKDGWLDFSMKTKNVPAEENCAGGQKFSAAPNNWIWLADIPKDAYELQMEIYGKSNIELSDNRPAYIEMGK
ncbi:MAG: LCP family protein [Eubacteriales bacterium]|nr:LCP family protein [Eubacteriales bacterium]